MMKKTIKSFFLFLTVVIMPLEALAYSQYVIPGGESIGIEIASDGIMIVGFYKVNGKLNKGTPNLKVGDRILFVEGSPVATVDELVDEMEKRVDEGEVVLTVLRDNKKKNIKLDLEKEDTTYKTGLYVKDEITGIGTLTYIDPETRIYGALGHNIVESNTNRTVEVRTGSIFRSSVTSIDRSFSGTPGGKNAKFYSQDTFGDIKKNISSGIYGEYKEELPAKKKLEVGEPEVIHTGKATIYTVLKGETQKEYEIEITKVDVDNTTKNIYFEVTDDELLAQSGGIVQGMSGSPIVQDDKIVGAVTHVVISNPRNGYGISIVKMLEDGEK